MAEYKLKNGYVLTDEEIERRAAEWESDDAEMGLVPLRVGRPPLSGSPMRTSRSNALNRGQSS